MFPNIWVFNQYIFSTVWSITVFGLAVWGGDPVYPTINYIQDPDEVIDYRGPDFHEPTPNMLSYLMEVNINGSPWCAY